MRSQGRPSKYNEFEYNNGGRTGYIMCSAVMEKEIADVRKRGELIMTTAIASTYNIHLI